MFGRNDRKKAPTRRPKKKKNSASAINRYQPIIEDGMCNLDTEELVKDTSSDSIFVWLASNPKELAAPKEGSKSSATNRYHNPLIQSIELPDADTALALHRSTAKHALYCRAPPAVEQVLVAKMLKDTGLGCGQYDPTGDSMTRLARGEVEMFVTSKAGGITDWHYDFQENFTLQLSGIKKWTLQKGTVQHPLRACTPHYGAPEVVENQLKAARLSSGAPNFLFDQPTTKGTDNETSFNAEGPTEVAILKPGDALYFPAGMWHKIEVLEPGVSINVSLMATNYANVTCQALQHLLLQRDEWRQVLVHGGADVEANALDHLKKLLQDLPSVVEEFTTQGGASAILPPVLLQPPNFQSTSPSQHHGNDSGSDGDDAEEADMDEEEEADSEPPAKKKAKSKGSSQEKHGSEEEMETDSGDAEENGEDDNNEWDEVVVEEEDDNIIDACEFQYPSGYTGPCSIEAEATVNLLGTHNLVCNPLALLLQMDQVTQYYNKRLHNRDSDSDEFLFVLNVNYAGIESHESSVRAVFRDNPERRYLDKLSKEPSSSMEELVKEIAKACPNLIHCLLYYGFLVVVPKKR